MQGHACSIETIASSHLARTEWIISSVSLTNTNMSSPDISFTSIPILDFSLTKSPKTRDTFLSQLRHALINVGFLYLSNHTVSASVIDSLLEYIPKLFALPQQAKDNIAMANSEHFLGYSRLGKELTKGKIDQREQFDFATRHVSRWKEGDPDHYRIWGPCQVSSRFANKQRILMRSTLVATGRFDSRIPIHLRTISWPSAKPQSAFQHISCWVIWVGSGRIRWFLWHTREDAASGENRALSCHSRWTWSGRGPALWRWILDIRELIPRFFRHWLLTSSSNLQLLQASPHRGLQVQNLSGKWIDAPPIHGTFVVNIGKGKDVLFLKFDELTGVPYIALEFVTGGLARATSHRVLSPTGTTPRYSVPFFQNIGLDVRLTEKVLTCSSPFLSP